MDEQRHDVVVARRVSFTPWWVPFVRQLEKLISMVPTHRDTRSGRRNATQIRMVLLAGGILTVVLWDSPWAPLALIACVLALVVPLSQSRRRELLASLRARRTKATRIKRRPGVLEITEKHVTARVDDERVRRLRRGQLSFRDEGERLVLKVGDKKANTLFVYEGEGSPDLDAWVEQADLADLRSELDQSGSS